MTLYKICYSYKSIGYQEIYLTAQNFSEVNDKLTKFGANIISIEKIINMDEIRNINEYLSPADSVKRFRDKTGYSINVCKTILNDHKWNIEKALKAIKNNDI